MLGDCSKYSLLSCNIIAGGPCFVDYVQHYAQEDRLNLVAPPDEATARDGDLLHSSTDEDDPFEEDSQFGLS